MNYNQKNPTWNWISTLGGVLRFSTMLFVFMVVLENLTGIVTYLLLITIGLFILRHIVKIFAWYETWLKLGGNYGSIAMHAVIYIAAASLIIASQV